MPEHSVPPRLAVLRDFREEGWPSMDLVADMLVEQLRSKRFSDRVSAEAFCPAYVRVFSRLPLAGRYRAARNAERLMNRMALYPRAVRRIFSQFDLFHVADHSYAQLVHALPPERTGVFCHDLDTFRSILHPTDEPRPRWFRAMTSRILAGMQKAAVVFYSTSSVREQIERHSLIDPQRLVHAPYGTSPEFDPEPVDPEPATSVLASAWGDPRAPFVLHVGSCIPRKRIDVLLDVFAEVRRHVPDVRLLQIGGEWTDPQRAQIERLALGNAVVQMRGLSRAQLASLYRLARVVLQPSEAEGFGLPVIEALASGAVVIASDIPVLREVGGPAAIYCPVGDVQQWADVVHGVLAGAGDRPGRTERLQWASRYSWAAHAETIMGAYLSRVH